MTCRIVYVFDATHGVGIGHYARSRALCYWLDQALGYAGGVMIGWIDSSEKNREMIDAGTKLVDGDNISKLLKSLSPDLIFVDSYNHSQLRAVVEKFGTIPKVSFAEALESEWIPGFDVLLDPTFASESIPQHRKCISGIDAVLLNKENYVYSSGLDGEFDGVFFSCGQSEVAEKLGRDMRAYEYFSRALDVRPASMFGTFFMRGHGTVTVGDMNKGATEVVVSAGQSLWEASLNRDSFYLVPLNSQHTSILSRLSEHGVLRLESVSSLVDEKFEIYQCKVPLSTRKRILEPVELAKNILAMVLEGQFG
jgi:hypothetical protein